MNIKVSLFLASILSLMLCGCPNGGGNNTIVDASRQHMIYDAKSISQTLPSDVWGTGNGKFALDCGNTQTKWVNGKLTRIVELRGWIGFVSEGANSSIDGDWRDFHYALIPDVKWCLENGINLHELINPGTILEGSGFRINSSKDPHALAIVPVIKIEMNGAVNSVLSPLVDI